jgi:hypothetical protein
MAEKNVSEADPIALAQAQGAARGGCQTCKNPGWDGTIRSILNAMLLPVSDAKHVDLFYSGGQMLSLLRDHFDYPWRVRALERHLMACEHKLWGEILERRENTRSKRS